MSSSKFNFNTHMRLEENEESGVAPLDEENKDSNRVSLEEENTRSVRLQKKSSFLNSSRNSMEKLLSNFASFKPNLSPKTKKNNADDEKKVFFSKKPS